MQEWLNASVQWLLAALALPEVGLTTIFVVSLISATLLPLGSEPAVFGYVTLQPESFWAAVAVATVGNTIGGAISYWMGYGAHRGVEKIREHHHEHHPEHIGPPRPNPDPVKQARHDRWHRHAQSWLDRWGPKTLLLSWVPLVGDPLCAVAGWLRLDFWPSLFYMAIGKLARYITMTAGLLWLFPHL